MSSIWFAPDDDPRELVKALEVEGYAVRSDPGTTAAGDPVTMLTVTPFDDGVEALVDVYGGWLPGDTRVTDETPGSDAT